MKKYSFLCCLALILISFFSWSMEEGDIDFESEKIEKKLNLEDLPDEILYQILSYFLIERCKIPSHYVFSDKQKREREVSRHYYLELGKNKTNADIMNCLKTMSILSLSCRKINNIASDEKFFSIKELVGFIFNCYPLLGECMFMPRIRSSCIILMKWAKLGCSELLKSFADAGLKIGDITYEILSIASRNKRIEFCKALIDLWLKESLKGNPNKELIWAIYLHDNETVRAIINAGYETSLLNEEIQLNVEGIFKLGFSELMMAVDCGNMDALKLLLEKSTVERINYIGFHTTALDIAIKHQNCEMIELLLTKGADANLMTNYQTPLNRAVAYGNVAVVKLLLSYGVEVDQTIKNEALMSASVHGHEQIVKLFLELGADVSFENEYGIVNSLILAEAQGHYHIVKILIEHLDSLNQKNT